MGIEGDGGDILGEILVETYDIEMGWNGEDGFMGIHGIGKRAGGEGMNLGEDGEGDNGEERGGDNGEERGGDTGEGRQESIILNRSIQ